MARTRHEKTLADYLAIAVAPLLIMLLVGSVAYLLLSVLPAGKHASRLGYILFWFTIAIVLVARIAIQIGQEKAHFYSFALAAATCLAVFRFSDRPLVAIPIMAAIWYCAHKLTFDCTLIDDEVDASGKGLVHATGLEPDHPQLAESSTQSAEDEPSQQQTTSEAAQIDKWEKLHGDAAKQEPHAPGSWIVKFSLIALPIFGLAPALAVADTSGSAATESTVLWSLVIFVSAGLTLLVVTSFLGLRRYLRQRRIRMPKSIAVAWTAAGAALVVGVVLFALLVPRPKPLQFFSETFDRLAGDRVDANSTALNNSDAGDGDGQKTGEPGEDQKQNDDQKDRENGNEEQEANDREGRAGDEKGGGRSDDEAAKDQNSKKQGEQQQNGKPKGDGKQKGDGEKQDDQNEDAEGGEQSDEESESEGEQQNDPDSSSSSNPVSQSIEWIQKLFGWLFKAVLIIGGIVLLIRYWRELLGGLVQFLIDIRNFIASLFGGKPVEREETVEEEAEAVPLTKMTFDECPNPFLSGTPDPESALRMTYDAVLVWMTEQGYEHVRDLAPEEVARQLSEQFFMQDQDGSFGENLTRMARAYSAMAYGRRVPSAKLLPALEQLWTQLRSLGGVRRVKRSAPVTTLKDF